MSKVTINDIARVCGVSKVTVSYVLNDTKRASKISEGTKARVKAAALELGYHPNALARGLTNQRTDSLVMVMQYTEVFTGGSAFITEMMHAAMNSAAKYGFDLILQTKTRTSAHDEISGIVDGRSDGALLLRDAQDPIAEVLVKRNFPAVFIFSESANVLVSSVDCDNVAGGRIATEYLIRNGHRRIAYCGGKAHNISIVQRQEGYVAAMTEAGLSPDWICPCATGDTELVDFYNMMSKPDRPTAIFCWNDDLASALTKFLNSKFKLKVPEDISIVGFDSTVFAEYTTPRMTSIRQPFDRIMDASFSVLKGLIVGDITEVQTIRFEPELDVRDSCRAI